MSAEDRLTSLALRWEELREAGTPASVEELCRDAPDLAIQLRARLRALEGMGWLSASAATSIEGNTPLPDGHTPSPPPTVPGYRLIERIGRGGFGEVWRADGPGGFPVALKLIPLDTHAAPIEERALDAIKALRHPHLLTIFGAWRIEQFLIVAMELAECTLLDLLRDLQPKGLSRDALVDYLRQAAAAIDYLNEVGRIQHRDIKPHNLLLVNGVVKVADMGLARVVNATFTSHSGHMTFAYAAPECFDGKTTAQSDQYSLAITYCQLRGGKLPFDGSPAEMMAGHLNRSPDLSMIPAQERAAVIRALAKPPTERWPNCRAFVDSLAQADGDKSRAPKLSRRGWLKWIGVGAGAAIMGGIGWGFRNRFIESDLKPNRENEPASLPQASKPDPVQPTGLDSFLEKDGVTPFDNLVRALAVSHDGRFVVTNGGNGPHVFDAKTRKLLRQLDPKNGGPGVACAPEFGPLVATGHDDTRVVLWNSETGEKIKELKGHTSSVSGVAFSEGATLILSGGCDRSLRLWDVKKGTTIVGCGGDLGPGGHRDIINCVALYPSGRRGLSAGKDQTLRLWDLENGKELTKFDVPLANIRAIAVTFDSRFALVAHDDGILRKWNLETGEKVLEFVGHDGPVHSVAVNRGVKQTRVVSGGGDRTARLWDMDSGKQLALIPIPFAKGCPVGAVAMEDSSTAIVGGAGLYRCHFDL